MKKSLKVGMLVTLSVASFQLASLKESVAFAFSGVWNPRSVEDVKANLSQKDEDGNVIYEIQYGDTLNVIAQAFDMEVQEVASLNKIDNPDLIYAGALLTFNAEAQTISFANEEGEEVATYSTENGREIVEDGTLYTPVTEWVEEEETEAETEPTSEVEYLLTAVEETEESMPEMAMLTARSVLEDEEPAEEVSEETTLEAEPELEETVAEEESVVEEPVVDEPIVEEPLVEDPIIEEPVIEEPVVDEPVQTGTCSFGPGQEQEAFQAIVAAYGVSAADADNWAYLIGRESGWNTLNWNSGGSGAYGLPQALPGNKMASHGADWETNPYTQLAWMYDYMMGRYGSIGGAVDHFNTHNWY